MKNRASGGSAKSSASSSTNDNETTSTSSKNGSSAAAAESKLKKSGSLDKKDSSSAAAAAAAHKRSRGNATNANSDRNKLMALPLTIVLGVSISWLYSRYLAGLVNTPLNVPRVINESSYKSPENIDRFWGTYRSNLYFGLKTRSPEPLMAGLMWFNQFSKEFKIRHWCDQNDGLLKYGWIAHDGRNFGTHDIFESVENSFSIRTSWVKRAGGRDGGDWTARTRISPFSSEQTPVFASTIFYFATDYAGWIKTAAVNNKKSASFVGETKDVGKFRVKIDAASQQTDEKMNQVYLDMTQGNVSVAILKETLIQDGFFARLNTKSSVLKEYIGFRKERSEPVEDSSFVAVQISGFLPFEFEVIFESESSREGEGSSLPELSGAEFDSTLADYHAKFTEKFENTFGLRDKNFSASGVIMAQSAFSNLIGGIGFFTGQSIVKSLSTKEPVLYWPANLYTAVPSRSFFPRGFLWDEGFHNILLSKWDLEITKDIVGHWLDLMNTEGWIPREVILGDEARARVPAEFVIQSNQNANPPTLFLPLHSVIQRINQHRLSNPSAAQADLDYLNHIFARLEHWYGWFNRTQIGSAPFTYRWRGRSSDSKQELNPKTLTSGLDDFPRASHPTGDERHLDLRCWMAWASKVMADLSDIVRGGGGGDDKESTTTTTKNAYRVHYEALRDNSLLDKLHWSSSQYADWGFHSDRVKLVRPRPPDERTPPNSMPMIRVAEEEPTYQFVNSVGYVSLFPMLLELVDADSSKLGQMLDQIRDPKHLWTQFGLRSLSKSAPLYGKRNTEHDPPYWRSAIWININYLTLKSLKHYASIDGPNREKAAKIYAELRQNLITNMLNNYETTGYIWEQYNDVTGRGQGSHPFTGWSSLIVLIMGEIYV